MCYVPSSLPFSTPQGEGAIKLAALDIPFGDAVSRGGEFCHLDLLVPGQALYYLSYTPLVPVERIKLPYSGPKPDALPLSDTGMVPEARFERATNGFRDRCASVAPLGINRCPAPESDWTLRVFSAALVPRELAGHMRDLACPAALYTITFSEI